MAIVMGWYCWHRFSKIFGRTCTGVGRAFWVSYRSSLFWRKEDERESGRSLWCCLELFLHCMLYWDGLELCWLISMGGSRIGRSQNSVMSVPILYCSGPVLVSPGSKISNGMEIRFYRFVLVPVPVRSDPINFFKFFTVESRWVTASGPPFKWIFAP